jgi:hypothetical protein
VSPDIEPVVKSGTLSVFDCSRMEPLRVLSRKVVDALEEEA